MKLQSIFAVMQLWLLGFPCLAQAPLTGNVHNAQRQPIEGAHVLHVPSGNHVHTNGQGAFTLEAVAPGDSLVVSHVGYQRVVMRAGQPGKALQVIMKEEAFALEGVQVSARADALNLLADIGLKTNPVNSSQEVLRRVPGLFIGQHAGGGKAEQLFLRGFDIDHGTDVALSVDGMPVNMVSHAHGQGYADLHFLIPETLEGLAFGKGPYDARQGNFATAGHVALRTKERLGGSQIKLEGGQFGTRRALGMFELLNQEQHSAYVAAEHATGNGPFESPQHLQRLNALVQYTGQLPGGSKLSLRASHFSSEWNASGQVPQRAVDSGAITRFGAIDDTEGGNTRRSNVVLQFTKPTGPGALLRNTVYYSAYGFELYSNFTFFLNDPVNGDQIRQYETRQLYGFSSEYSRGLRLGQAEGSWQAGIGLRADDSRENELAHTANRRTTLQTHQLGNIYETNTFAYLNGHLALGPLTINPALRLDYFDFRYQDQLAPTYQVQSAAKALLSPKLNLVYSAGRNFQAYLKAGQGFHSNDTRVAVNRQGRDILPAAWGADVGTIWKPMPALVLNAALWHLYLQQEFVYVGDEGVVEPSGETRRTGLDFSLRHQPTPWLYWHVDVNHTLARALHSPEGEHHIPLAPRFTGLMGLNVDHPSGFYGGASLRHMANRPATEDFSLVAQGYTVVDANAGYQWRSLSLDLAVQNLFNTAWNETQFATLSRLAHEASPVEEIHFTPGSPFFLKGTMALTF